MCFPSSFSLAGKFLLREKHLFRILKKRGVVQYWSNSRIKACNSTGPLVYQLLFFSFFFLFFLGGGVGARCIVCVVCSIVFSKQTIYVKPCESCYPTSVVCSFTTVWKLLLIQATFLCSGAQLSSHAVSLHKQRVHPQMASV